MEHCCQNTDKELWREPPGDAYSNNIHVTKENSIGINCGGHVLVMPIQKWHIAGKLLFGCIDVGCRKSSKWRLFKIRLARGLLYESL